MKITILIIAFAGLMIRSAGGQHVSQMMYGGAAEDRLNTIIQTRDGGYLIGGRSQSVGNGRYAHTWILKFDADHRLQWTKTLGNTSAAAHNTNLSQLYEASDGSLYVLVSDINYFTTGEMVSIMYRLEPSDGRIIDHNKLRHAGGNSQGYDFIPRPGGGFLVASYPFVNGAHRAGLFVLDERMQIVQSRYIDDGSRPEGRSLAVLRNGSIVLGCRRHYQANNRRDVSLAVWDAAAQLLETRSYTTDGIETLSKIAALPDGGLLIAGSRGPRAISDVLLIRLDEQLNPVWGRSYTSDSPGEDLANDVVVVEDGEEYIVAGLKAPCGGGRQGNAYLMSILPADGSVNWIKEYGGSRTDQFFAVTATQDGGLLACGAGYTDGATVQDGYVVKTDSRGSVCGSRLTSMSVAVLDFEIVRGGKAADAGFLNQKQDLSEGSLSQMLTLCNHWEEASESVPKVDAGPDTTIVCDSTIRLDGRGDGLLSWAPAAGLSDPRSPDPIAVLKETTTYVLTVTDRVSGCQNSDSVTISVANSFSVDAGPDTSICAGTSLMLRVEEGDEIRWRPSVGLSDPTSATPTVQPEESTRYIVTVSRGLCTGSDTVVVDVTRENTEIVASGGERFEFPDATSVGGMRCDNITLHNLGADTRIIRRVNFAHYQDFSAPHSQFPIEIPGKSSANIRICFHPGAVGNLGDSLHFAFDCGRLTMALKGLAASTRLAGISQCTIPIRVGNDNPPGSALFISSPFPNPTAKQILVAAVLQDARDQALADTEGCLRDIYGRLLRRERFVGSKVATDGALAIASAECRICVEDLPNGLYYLTVHGPAGYYTFPVVVAR